MYGWLKNHIWYLHTPVIMLVYATPSMCLQTLMTNAKPSTQRLHLRNLFAQGRRYQITPNKTGFDLTTTSKVTWQYRKRTVSSSMMRGKLSPIGEDITRVELETHIAPFYLLDCLFIPTFMTSLIVFMPWHPLLIGWLSAVLYLLSWVGHRYNARMEAHEMIWFVQKALEELTPATIPELDASTDHIIIQREFEQIWQQFYEEISRKGK
ncbi:MAG: hypothetical protein Kow00117_20870 [Phototrophicales bacterium]|nr:MAG: hypothetical protein CUN56_09800 [Phototrophicales bacterium]RMG74590.1 MAG: hypothetical protein D6711_08435 [Chloroflexota bacterium]